MSEWKSVVGYEGVYEVSDGGSVQRCDGYRSSPKPLQPVPNHHGYLNVNLSRNSKGKTFKVHSLVCEAFIGPRPEGMTINHKNGDKNDNSVQNLEYVTHIENMRHAKEVLDRIIPTRARGERNGAVIYPERLNRGTDVSTAKLDENKVRAVRVMLSQGMFQRDIAKIIGISQTQIWRIKTGLSWAHVS